MSSAPQAITVTHHVQGQGGTYVAHIEGERMTGYLEWEPAPGSTKEQDIRIATHTVVPKPISGRGVAAQLVRRLVADAHRHGFKIVPRCSYVAAKFDENPDWSDLRAE